MTKAAAYAIGALVLSGTVILSGSALGLLNYSSSGGLSILLTDPPAVPDGVTAVFISYSNIQVHAVGFGDAGWVNVPGQGTIDTLGLVNLSRTISTSEVPTLTYNMIRFNISGVSVEFTGKNYSATVDSGRLTVPFVGGLKVNSSDSSAALVDISPTILNLGNESDPNFTMAAGARALQVPHGDVRESMKVIGNETSLQGRGWFESFRSNRSDSITVSGLALSADSFAFSAVNPGSDRVTIRLIVITPNTLKQTGASFGSLSGSFVFAVGSDGSLTLLNGSAGDVSTLFGGPGYVLAGGGNHQFIYADPISSLVAGHVVTRGFSYTVAIIGSGPLSVETVVAT